MKTRFGQELHGLLVIATGLGAVSGGLGTWISTLAPKIPTGPVMGLVATGGFIASAVFAPRRGVISRLLRLRQNRLRESRHHFLRAFGEVSEIEGKQAGLEISRISDHLSEEPKHTRRTVGRLERGGWLSRQGSRVLLTEQGRCDAEFVLKSHRLWEYYLVYRSNLKLDHVDRPADDVEHILTPDIVRELEETLREAEIDIDSPTSLHPTDAAGTEAL